MDGGKREAAVHFSQYLCARGFITANQHSISKDHLRDIFKNDYQPQYAIQCLEVQSLISALAKASLISKQHTSETVDFKWRKLEEQKFIVGQLPGCPPARLTKPRPRILVSQRFACRENYKRSSEEITDKCKYCNIKFESDHERLNHINSELHILLVKYREQKKEFDAVKSKLQVWVKDEDRAVNDISVPVRPGQKKVVTLCFMNRLDLTAQLEKVLVLIPSDGVEMENLLPCDLIPGEEKTLTMKVHLERGATLYPIVFKVWRPQATTPEYFLKDVIFRVQSVIMDALKPVAPYCAPVGPILKLKEGPVLPGVSVPFVPFDLKFTLKLHVSDEIPKSLNRFLNHGFKEYENMTNVEKEELEQIKSLIGEGDKNPLSASNYSKLLQLLLFMEEHQMKKDIHNYDMHDAVLKRSNDLLWLEVPGLADKRPSLLINDSIEVNYVGDYSINFEGRVHRITGTRAYLGFNPKFAKEYDGRKVEVRFTINRCNLRSMHQALLLLNMHDGEELMFPSERSKPKRQPPLRPWFNPRIKTNPEQQTAVRNIVWHSSQNSPYLIFGPPGTGKTITMVETILQLWEPTDKTRHILVCAPSNTAADVITERLLPEIQARHPVKHHLIRLYAMSRTWKDVPVVIKGANCTNHNQKTGEVIFPRKEVIMQYDIVVTTFCTAARLVKAQITPGHFSHILMDEVGQAMEPEALIPIAALATSSDKPGKFLSSVVMAGDPKQLGPILQSPWAMKFGLDKSMLERLMELELYQKDRQTCKYDPNVITKLIRNYRSHEKLLLVPNKLFYDNELKAEGDPKEVNVVCAWSGLLKQNFPMIFHGVEGYDEREGSSPSYFNRQEIELVLDYIDRLLQARIVNTRDIGIVTPYSKQVQKFRKAFMLKNFNDDLLVGSVEQFQGQERKVIIISTVRSRVELIPQDYIYQLGFLKNPKRFNVAVTRARALLIVVGNPNVLQHDNCWKELLNVCIENGVYTGVPFSPLKTL